jgi:hypothetical protein
VDAKLRALPYRLLRFFLNSIPAHLIVLQFIFRVLFGKKIAFIGGIVNDAVTSSDYVASRGRMVANTFGSVCKKGLESNVVSVAIYCFRSSLPKNE